MWRRVLWTSPAQPRLTSLYSSLELSQEAEEEVMQQKRKLCIMQLCHCLSLWRAEI